MKKHIFKGCVQIILLVMSIFAFAYIISEVKDKEIIIIKKQNRIIGLLALILKLSINVIFNQKSLVSAFENSDLSNGVATCIKGKDGSICQEYPSSECSQKCGVECAPSTRENVPGCKLGTCYDSDSGICQERASENECESNGGKWFDNTAGNVLECQKGCCLIGDDVSPLITQRECTKIGEIKGITTAYHPEIKNEISCLALARAKVEGACVFEQGEKKCRFTTKGECLENGGIFNEGLLCTNPSLGMNYQKQATAKCIEGQDEIYWFDNQGNRENIYDANKVKSWNDGVVLSKLESCDGNPKTCGNCNRLTGSVCGQKTSNEKLSDNSIDVVCLDLRCKDKTGMIRENGESWCEYQGDIGVEKGSSGLDRSVDTPGSTHFRATCVDGEVQVNSCADYRNEICIEERAKRDGDNEQISSSACVVNLWQLCLNYNSEVKGEGPDRQNSLDARNEKCNKNPLCVLKKVDAADNFKFDLCVPKYAPGFDLNKNAEGGELSCAFGSQKCTVISVKKIDGWDVKVNAGCLKQGFTEQMNDLCMSLGDCGASVNYQGDFTENYKVINAPKLGESYIDQIKKYSEPVKDKYAKVNVSAYFDAIGGIEKLRGSFNPDNCKNLPGGELADSICYGDLNTLGLIAGGLGVLMIYSPAIIAAVSQGTLATAAVAGEAGVVGVAGGTGASTGTSAALTGIGGALAGAAIGFAVTALLIQYTGVGAGLDPAVVWTLIGAGTVGGAILGATFVSGFAAGGLGGGLGALTTGLTLIPIIGWVLIVVVILVIVIFKAIGIGDVKKKVVEFQCQPWQAPLGGDKCSQCGKDDYPCSKYACQSLGQSCQLINEGAKEQKCVDINPGDVSAPIIGPLNNVLSPGFKYQEVSDKGVKIVSDDNDGCISSYQNIVFGISLNEPGYCRYEYESKSNFDNMGLDFGSRNLFLYNHTQFFTIPDLTSLVPGLDPNRRADLNFHIRCIDSKGNGKDSKEYLINLCVKPGFDITKPIITGREPFSEFVKFDAQKLDASVFVSEPAECKWDLDNVNYDSMKYSMQCENDVVERNSFFGWKCGTTFPIEKTENKFYVRCKDQPWYGENWQGEGSENIETNETKRNVMTESYEFIVKRTKATLNIDYIKPNGTLIFGVVPATVVLEAKTSGGIDGKATCKLFGGELQETFGTIHKQTFNQIFSGNYEFPIICTDSAGNEAQALSSFTAELDVDSPRITRAYNKDNNLIIATNENAKCAFVEQDKVGNCNFEFSNATMMSGEEKIHTTSFDKDSYYIKCKDNFENAPGKCSIVVKRGD